MGARGAFGVLRSLIGCAMLGSLFCLVLGGLLILLAVLSVLLGIVYSFGDCLHVFVSL